MLNELIVDIQRIKADPWASAEAVSPVAPLLSAFIGSQGLGAIDFSPLSQGRYTRRLLTAPEEDFQLVLALWGPHSASPIHDHDEVTGVVAAYVGEVLETKYSVIARETSHVTLAPGETVRLKDAFISPILPDATRQLHQMSNATAGWAATLHLYLTPLKAFSCYRPRPAGGFWPERTPLWFDGA